MIGFVEDGKKKRGGNKKVKRWKILKIFKILKVLSRLRRKESGRQVDVLHIMASWLTGAGALQSVGNRSRQEGT